jgi:hypothetical protein
MAQKLQWDHKTHGDALHWSIHVWHGCQHFSYHEERTRVPCEQSAQS